MSEFNIEVEGGSSVRLPTGGKYCPKDIIVTAKGGSGGSVFDKYVAGETTEVESAATQIVANAFYSNQIITSASFPNATTVGKNAFNRASALTNLQLPQATVLNESALTSCTKLVSVEFPKVRTVYRYVFQYCSLLESIDFHDATYIAAYAFQNCNALKSVTIRSQTICTLVNKNAFEYCTHFTSTKDGYIYVPANLVDAYKSNTNWGTYASQIRAIGGFGGGAGEQLPMPIIMLENYEGEYELYLSDYGNATSVTFYASAVNDGDWVEVATYSIMPNSQETVLQDTLLGWVDGAGLSGNGSAYFSAITHADGYADSERVISNEFMF